MDDSQRAANLANMNRLLELIRFNRSALYGLFSMMPKGGDLHHHYTGAIYTENYVNYVFQKDYYYNADTGEVMRDTASLSPEHQAGWKKLSEFPNKEAIRLILLRAWSVKDFVKGKAAPDEHFFSTFRAFSCASSQDYIAGLKELKNRALSQRLTYLETMFCSINTEAIKLPDESQLDSKLWACQDAQDQESLHGILQSISDRYGSQIKEAAHKHTQRIEEYHDASHVDDDAFVLRFQNYVSRYKQPTDVFVDLFACFHSCDSSSLISGINIVGAENAPTAMHDYWLHMMFFKFLEANYPNVHYAIHAGELVEGMVPPEYLGTHIKQALVLSNVKRIGHGVDIIYDNAFIETMEELQRRGIVVEINLTSNEFILGVARDMHPVEMYYRNGIPIVVCTDDEGVLRTSITEQYVLLANRYELSYGEIRGVVKNSIKFASLEDEVTRARLMKRLEASFDAFEAVILGGFPGMATEEVAGDGKGRLAEDGEGTSELASKEMSFGPLKFKCLTAD
jgi:adenosine deaminase